MALQRLKPAEILGLKEEVLERLDAFVQQALSAAPAALTTAVPDAATPAAAATAAAAAAAAAADPGNPETCTESEQQAVPVAAAATRVATAAAALSSSPAAAAAAVAAAAVAITPHDLCMLLRSFADLTPRDSPMIIRLLYVLLLACRVQPPAPEAAAAATAAAAAAVAGDGRESSVGVSPPGALGGSGPLTAQVYAGIGDRGSVASS